MSRLTRDGTAEPVSRDQNFRHARGQGNVHFPCSADHEQDWQPYPVDPYSAICDDHTYIHTVVEALKNGGLSYNSWLVNAVHARVFYDICTPSVSIEMHENDLHKIKSSFFHNEELTLPSVVLVPSGTSRFSRN